MKKSKFGQPLVLTISIVFLLTVSGTVFSQTSSTQEEKSLYERLGGLPAIALIVSDFVDVFMVDPVILSNTAVKDRKHLMSVHISRTIRLLKNYLSFLLTF